MSVKAELDFFDPNTLKPMSNLYIVGKRDCGKSNLLKNIIPYIAGNKLANRIRRVAAISETEKYNHFYRDEIGVHPDYIAESVDQAWLSSIVNEQKEYFLSLPENERSSSTVAGAVTQHGLLIIFDDVSHKKKSFRAEQILEIMQAGRHCQICIMMVVQDPLTMAAEARGCFDNVFISGMPGERERRAMRAAFFGKLKESTFCATLDHYTDDYGFLVYKSQGQLITWFRGENLQGKCLDIGLQGRPMKASSLNNHNNLKTSLEKHKQMMDIATTNTSDKPTIQNVIENEMQLKRKHEHDYHMGNQRDDRDERDERRKKRRISENRHKILLRQNNHRNRLTTLAKIKPTTSSALSNFKTVWKHDNQPNTTRYNNNTNYGQSNTFDYQQQRSNVENINPMAKLNEVRANLSSQLYFGKRSIPVQIEKPRATRMEAQQPDPKLMAILKNKIF